jgi:hypothetical protein
VCVCGGGGGGGGGGGDVCLDSYKIILKNGTTQVFYNYGRTIG